MLCCPCNLFKSLDVPRVRSCSGKVIHSCWCTCSRVPCTLYSTQDTPVPQFFQVQICIDPETRGCRTDHFNVVTLNTSGAPHSLLIPSTASALSSHLQPSWTSESFRHEGCSQPSRPQHSPPCSKYINPILTKSKVFPALLLSLQKGSTVTARLC